MENPVISREYVEKNYIKKQELKNFINAELKAINKCRKDVGFLTNQQYDAIEAVYKAIKNIFLGETEDENNNTFTMQKQEK